MTDKKYGPGLNGWPAHGYTDTQLDNKPVCYCRADFTSKMALNKHVEAETIAEEQRRIAREVRKLWCHEWPDDFDDRVAITSYNSALGAVLFILEGL